MTVPPRSPVPFLPSRRAHVTRTTLLPRAINIGAPPSFRSDQNSQVTTALEVQDIRQ